jgi:hypothetical protein
MNNSSTQASYKDVQNSDPWMLSKISNNIRLRDTLLLSYTKSGSRHLYLEYFRMYNLVQGDVKRQNKYIYIYIYIYI